MYRAMLPAVERGARLIAFPEDVATGLMGVLPGSSRLFKTGLSAFEGDSAARVAELFALADPAVRAIYHETFSGLARLAGVWVAAGSANLSGEDGRVYNEARLYAPDGGLAGVQRKLNLMAVEREWGLREGSQLRVFSLDGTRLFLPVCNDAGYWETFRWAVLAGAEIAIVPQADPDEYVLANHLRGAWARVQESPAFAVVSCLVGELAGVRLSGKSAIYAPLEISPRGDGVLARVEDHQGPGMAIADLDLEVLRAYRRESGILAGLRPDVYAHYFPSLYWSRRPGDDVG
jgi:predicted amidohydrolase